jgi:hypothetical protein
VKKFFSDLWEGIKKVFGSVADFFKNIFKKAWDAVLGVFSAGGKVFAGIKEGILSVFKTVVNGLIDGINTVVALPFKGLNGILDTIQNVNFLGISPFSWLTWRAPVPQLPRLATGGVLEKGQVGLLEGSGAEAVVPLEKNTEWIQRVAREFMEQMNGEMAWDGFDPSRPAPESSAPGQGGLMGKLDKILSAIERGQILTIDGAALVGATAERMDATLGQRRELVARGAL